MKKGKILKCHHCGYIWGSRTKAEFYTGCPRCTYKVNVKKRVYDPNTNTVKSDLHEKQGLKNE